MKTAILILCVLCATAALGQTAGVLSNQPQIVDVPTHPLHASQHELATEQSLLQEGSYGYAKGERPLWEFGPITQPAPLGDIARAYRKDHASAKKAGVIFEKYVAQK
jgi:hypothetical protein